MVEVKFGDKWPRDPSNIESEAKRDWRNFEVGDRIDISDVRSTKTLIVTCRVMSGRLAE